MNASQITTWLRKRPAWAFCTFLGSCVLIGIVCWFFSPTLIQQLQPYLGQDLRNLSEGEQLRFDRLIGNLAPDARVFHKPSQAQGLNPRGWWDYYTAKPQPPWFGPESWYLWQVVNDQGQGRLVLFQALPLRMIPGASSARLFVFDRDGHRLKDCEFQTGWRIDIKDARWLEDCGHGFSCVLVNSSASINGCDIARQYYAFLDDAFVLVRLEDSQGDFLPVNYRNPNFTIGPAIPDRTAAQWEAALRSPNRAEVLRTLIWLGGIHLDPPLPNDKTICIEAFEDAMRAKETRTRPGVYAAVEALTKTDDPWFRDAVKHAQEAIEGRDR